MSSSADKELCVAFIGLTVMILFDLLMDWLGRKVYKSQIECGMEN